MAGDLSAMSRKPLALKGKGASKRRYSKSKQVGVGESGPHSSPGAQMLKAVLVFTQFLLSCLSCHGNHHFTLTLEERYDIV